MSPDGISGWAGFNVTHPEYLEYSKDSRRKTFFIDKPVKLYGGFSGNGQETQLEERDWETNKTILSGNIRDINNPNDDCFVILSFNSSYNGLMSGFTIEDASGIEHDDDFYDSGVFI